MLNNGVLIINTYSLINCTYTFGDKVFTDYTGKTIEVRRRANLLHYNVRRR